jgi:hypothetical protein
MGNIDEHKSIYMQKAISYEKAVKFSNNDLKPHKLLSKPYKCLD